MNLEQRALRFQCQGSSLVGVVDVPERPLQRGVLLLADGPQYRVGGHRQFTLLSRVLAAHGIPVMRFDRRGMGDSEGAPRACDAADDDVRAAVKEFSTHLPDMREVVLLAMGDAASAAVLYAPLDERVRGLVLLNPQMQARAPGEQPALRHHYLERLGDVAFWKKVAAGQVDFAAGAAALRDSMRTAAQERRTALPRRVVASLAGFDGHVLVMLGGADPSAHEAARLLARHHVRCKRVAIPHGGRAFASREWRDSAATAIDSWIASW